MSLVGACVLASAAHTAAQASESDALLGLPETISIATGRAQNINTAPAVANLITAEQIRNSGIRDIPEALRLVPGMHVGMNMTYGMNIGVRGFTFMANEGILYLLDGVPMPTVMLDHSMAALGTIPIDMVDRIEVTRGPGSVVFGADAFSAVINVITKKTPDGNLVAASGGSWDTAKGRARVGFSTHGVDGVIGVSAMTTNGYHPYVKIDNQSIFDEQMGTSASLAPGYANTSRREIGLMMNLSSGNSEGMLRYSRMYDLGLAAGISGNLDPDGTQGYDTYEARIAHNVVLTDDFQVKLTADAKKTTWGLDNAMFLPPGAFGVFRNGAYMSVDNTQETQRLQADAHYDGFETHRPTFGAGYQNITDSFSGESINYFILDNNQMVPAPGFWDPDTPPVNSHLFYGYAEDEWSFMPKWTFTYGARVDEYSTFGTQFSPRAVLVWAADPLWTFKLLYGQGFRPPTILETERFPIPAYTANPELEPERLRSLDLSVGYAPTSRLNVQLNVFANETVDQIRQRRLPNGAYVPENVGDQRGRGGELTLNWTILPQLSFYGWYSYQWNTDETTGENAGYSPQHRLYGSLQYTIGKAFFNLQGYYVGDRARIYEDTRENAPSYGRLGLLGRYQVSKELSLELDIRNLLNQQSYEASAGTAFAADYQLPARNYYLTMRVDF